MLSASLKKYILLSTVRENRPKGWKPKLTTEFVNNTDVAKIHAFNAELDILKDVKCCSQQDIKNIL